MYNQISTEKGKVPMLKEKKSQQVNYLVLDFAAFYGNALIGFVIPVLLILILLALPSLKRFTRVSEAVEMFVIHV